MKKFWFGLFGSGGNGLWRAAARFVSVTLYRAFDVGAATKAGELQIEIKGHRPRTRPGQGSPWKLPVTVESADSNFSHNPTTVRLQQRRVGKNHVQEIRFRQTD